MRPETPNKFRFWSLVTLVSIGVAGLFLIPADSTATHSAPSHAVVPLDPDSPLVQAAARVFRGRSCAGCHYLKNIWGYDGLPLDHAAEKYDRDTLKRFIRNPKSVNARTLMPPQDKTTDAEIDAIANLLAGLPRAGTNSSSSHEHH